MKKQIKRCGDCGYYERDMCVYYPSKTYKLDTEWCSKHKKKINWFKKLLGHASI